MQVIPAKSPSLLRPPAQYSAAHNEELQRQLRLYFNQLDDNLRQLLRGFNHYGCFHQTADVTAAVANTAYPIAFNLTHHAFGISVSGADITVGVGGIYMLSFNAQVAVGAGANHHASFWPRINGVDETYSANRVGTDSNRERVAAWSYQLELQAGDVVQLMWAVSDTGVTLNARAASAPVPDISAIVANVFWLFPAAQN